MNVPTIDQEGVIGEVSLGDSPIRKNQPESHFVMPDGTVFDLCKFVSRLNDIRQNKYSERIGCVDIYVHPDFKKEVLPTLRYDEINKFVQQNAAWLFTYGIRIYR